MNKNNILIILLILISALYSINAVMGAAYILMIFFHIPIWIGVISWVAFLLALVPIIVWLDQSERRF